MKRPPAVALLMVLSILLVLCCGCGGGRAEDEASQTASREEGREGGEAARADYDLGLVEGYEDGFSQGYRDGKEGHHDPQPGPGPGADGDYAAGYEEGYLKGYEKGYEEGEAEAADGGEARAVEEAMLAFVKKNSAAGLEFEIEDIVIHGDQAAGRVVCTSERMENALVVMEKGPGGWYGVDFGTGVAAPSWYRP